MGPSGVVFSRDLAKVIEDVNKLTSDNDKGDFMSDNDYFYTFFGFPVPHPLDPLIIPDPVIESGPEGLSVPESDLVPVPGSDPISGSNDLMGAMRLVEIRWGSKGVRMKRTKGTKGWFRGCRIIYQTRTNGATAGVVDKYYVEPTTGKRLRSKKEVMRWQNNFGEPNKSD